MSTLAEAEIRVDTGLSCIGPKDLQDAPPEGTALAGAAEAARDYATAAVDRQASADYRRDLVSALVRRTVTKAADRARERA